MRKEKLLIVGANGQIGSVLTAALRDQYGENQVVTSDIKHPDNQIGAFEILDITDAKRLAELVETHEITQIYHLAALLSAKGEANPQKAWNINMTGLLNVLEIARTKNISKIYFPSSIAVFGSDAPKVLTPQVTPLNPETVYGISKVAGEHWCKYYHQKYGVDVRSLRYPGIIGPGAMPGGGTTDYAVDIYHHAIREEDYKCFLSEHTGLPMMYMDDAIRATLEIMEAPAEKIRTRAGYNLSGTSFTPLEITKEIQKHIPHFKVNFVPDFRQQIADTWPDSIDDSAAQQDWDWQPKFDLAAMTNDMLFQLEKKNSERLVSES